MVTLGLSGYEITDATRADSLVWGIGQQGGQTDGLQGDGSIFIGRAATNLFPNGQCDTAANLINANAGAGISYVTDAATPAPFSPQSIAVTVDGSAGNQGVQAISATGQAAPAGTNGVASVYFRGTAGQSYAASIRWGNTDATTNVGAPVTFNATGDWQLITPPPLAVAAAETGDQLRIAVYVNGTRAETFHIAHAMLEKGQQVVAPYVATSGGVTATKPAARVQAPAGLISGGSAVGFILRVRYGWDATARTDFPALVCWGNDQSNRLGIIWNGSSQKWVMDRRIAAAPIGASSAQDLHKAGDVGTLIGYYDGANVAISLNGSAFTKAADTRALSITTTTFDIGSILGTALADCAILFAATFTGTLTDTDAANIAAIPEHSPPNNYIGFDARLTASFPTPGTELLQPPIWIA